jgi:N-acetylglucosaminyldiphosphoundecaprenol N-acetyl-beta-D-mannosaminyltransferase
MPTAALRPPARANVLGVGISVINQTTAREILFDAARRGRRGYVAVTGVHGVTEAQGDPAFRGILNRALLCTPDGMPMVWMGQLTGHREIRRVYGPDLMLNLCEHSVGEGFTHFFYGGNTGVADDLKRTLENRYPGLAVAGTYCPPFRPLNASEREELRAIVDELRPDFFWVGLSTPKQEKFMAEYLPLLPGAKVFLGVGAAFDLLTGRVRQAPSWMQRSGLEWFYRLTQEPKRLARRYLINNPLFIGRAALQLSGRRKYSLD